MANTYGYVIIAVREKKYKRIGIKIYDQKQEENPLKDPTRIINYSKCHATSFGSGLPDQGI